MKWIQDLPDDFTQDFKFSVTGVDDPHTWLNDELKLGQREWDSIVTLTRDEILEVPLIRESILIDDLGEDVISWGYWNKHGLEGDIPTTGCCVVDDVIRRVSLGGQGIVSVPDLSALTGLTSLNLNRCKALQDVSGLSGLTGLTSLNLSSCEALQDVSGLSGLTGLTSLNLSSCEALQDVSGLSGLTGLTSLTLSSCDALQDVSGLSGLTGLTSLNLSSCDALQDVSGLSGLTGLTSLNLCWCDALQDVSVLSGLTGLTSLNLSMCEALQDVSVLSGLTGLTSLNLSMCKALQDVSVLSGLTGLTSLTLNSCDALQDVSVLSGLTGLTSLDLCWCKALQDVSGLSGLTGLTSLDLSGCKALQDVSVLSGLTGLTSLDLSMCPYVPHESNREAIAKLDTLKKLDGIGEPWNSIILWNAARRREGKADMAALLEKMLELCGSPMTSSRLRADFISGINVLDCSDGQMGQIHALDWSREEWARLLVVTQNQLDPVASGPQFGINQESGEVVMETDFTLFTEANNGQGAVNIGSGRIGIRNAMKGYILSVAEGARWDGTEAVLTEAFGHIISELNKEGVELHPSWDEGVVDLLMALRETGMSQEHDALFKAVTDQSRQAFDQQLRIQAAEIALDGGRWSDALQHMRDLPSAAEAQMMSRIIPMVVGQEVPEAILQWMETAADHDLGLLVENTGMTPAEGLQNRRIREQLFWLSASNAGMFRDLVGQMFAAFPDDPWVAALQAECAPDSVASSAGSSSDTGLLETLQSDTLGALLGPMVGQQLNAAIEGQSEGDLHHLAVALLLEHFGAVTPQFRDTILTALRTQSPSA